jgi:hypothetical protein
MKKNLTNVKISRLKKYLLLTAAILTALLVLALVSIAHKPGRYAPVKGANQNQISPYLTNNLLPTIYNNAQLDKPFEVVITQQGLNDIIARTPQPITLNDVTLLDPQVILIPGQIILMATVEAAPVNPVVTIELNPVINQQGQLTLHICRVTLGAVNITTMAKLIGDKAYTDFLSSTGMEQDNIAAQICRSLLKDEPFEPVFELAGKNLRVSKLDISAEKITALLTPAPVSPPKLSAASKH